MWPVGRGGVKGEMGMPGDAVHGKVLFESSKIIGIKGSEVGVSIWCDMRPEDTIIPPDGPRDVARALFKDLFRKAFGGHLDRSQDSSA